MPRGDTVLRVGDEVVVLVTDESEDDVRALLVGPAILRARPLRDEGVGRVVDHAAVDEVDGTPSSTIVRPWSMPAMRRRPANTAVIVPVPSLIITSRFGTPLRAAMRRA